MGIIRENTEINFTVNDQQQQQSASQFDELVDGVDAENGQFHRLLESPSTATLRARREPFLRVDYALQVK